MPRGKSIATLFTSAAVVAAVLAFARPSADSRGFATGPVEAKSLGAMTFGPGGVLFVADNDAESVYALDLADNAPASGAVNITGIDAKVAQALGTTPDQITIADMAVHPGTRNVYLSVMRGRGADAKAVLLKVTANASQPVTEVALDNIKHSAARITNAPAANPAAGNRDPRRNTVTDLAFADGRLWVAGLSNEQFSSAFRQIAYPFTAGHATTSLQIYHVSHRKSETQAPVMTFTPLSIEGKLHMLAAYTCTPLVAFDASGVAAGQQVVGRTVAELGAGNQPADILSYRHGGQDFVLVANRTHAMMKVSVADIAAAPALTTPDHTGIARTNVSAPGVVAQLADFDAANVLVIQKDGAGGFDLKTISKSSF